MANEAFEQLCRKLERRGADIAAAFALALEDLHSEFKEPPTAGPVHPMEPGQKPSDTPRCGLLAVHLIAVSEAEPTHAKVGWFLPDSLARKLSLEDADEAQAHPVHERLAEALSGEVLQIAQSSSKRSDDLWGDYLAGDLPNDLAWQRFDVSTDSQNNEPVYLVWPRTVLEQIFAAADSKSARSKSASQSTVAVPPVKTSTAKRTELSPGIQRVLKTRVPLVVTLAEKKDPAAKILQLGPGSIIEFDQSCEEPLQLAINNLPIGSGEAVKIGDHFGLRILSLASVEERVERLGGK